MTTMDYMQHIGVTTDLWTYLKNANRPIVLYGMGNGADKIIAVLEQNGIEFADIFASDAFVRGQVFHGKTVCRFQDLLQKYGQQMIVLMSFGSTLPEVITQVQTLANQCKFYIPDVPVCEGALFDLKFFHQHADRLLYARQLLHDTTSQILFDMLIRYKLTGRLDFLYAASTSEEDEVFLPDHYRCMLDAGAYNGDTIRMYAMKFPHLEKVFALEPDPKTFKKLENYAQQETRFDVYTHHLALSDHAGIQFFASSSNKGSNLSDARKTTRQTPVELSSIDLFLDGASVDFIKYDVEGAEAPALRGTAQTCQQWQPDLAVSLYHRSEDLFLLPEIVANLCTHHRFYLRRKMCIPAWETMLYAIR